MKRIISVLVAAVLLCTMFAACAKEDGETTAATVTVTIEADGTTILENASVTIEGIDGEAPYAFDAIIQALDDNEIEYELGELAGYERFEKIDEYDIEGNTYIWELTINGDEVETKMNFTEVEDGDKLVLTRNAGVDETATSEETTVETTAEAVETVNDGYEE